MLFRAWVLVGLLLLSARAEADDFRNGLALEGYTGLLLIPDAHVGEEGTAEVLYSPRLDPRYADRASQQHVLAVRIGLLPYLEVVGRVTEIPGDPALTSRPFLLRDLSLNLKLQLPLQKLSPYLPAIAVGTQDEGGAAPHFRSRYLVATETLGFMRLTAGYGTGPDRLQGFFGGAEARLHESVSLIAEHDGEDTSAGARVSVGASVMKVPLRFGLLARTSLQQNPGAFDFGVSLAVPFAGEAVSRSAPVDVAASAIPERGLPSLQSALVDIGFENVRVGKAGTRVIVEYENEVYNRSEEDGLRVVLSAIRAAAPEGFDSYAVRILQSGLAVAEVRGSLADTGIGEVVSIPFADVDAEYLQSAPQNGTFGHVRLTLSPGLRTFFATEVAFLDYVVSIRPELTVPLWKGAAAYARWDLPVAWSANLREGGPLAPYRTGPALDHALLYQGMTLAPKVMALVGAGVFRRENAGVLGELAWNAFGGAHQFGLQGSYTRTLDGRENPSLLGVYRLWFTPLEVDAVVRAGQFFEGDRGVSVELARYFGDTRVGLYASHTGNTFIGGMVSLPLSFRKDMKPGWLQIRGPSRWSYSQGTQVRADQNQVQWGNATIPTTAYNLDEIFFDGGRLRGGNR